MEEEWRGSNLVSRLRDRIVSSLHVGRVRSSRVASGSLRTYTDALRLFLSLWTPPALRHPMASPHRLQLLQRQIAWHLHFSLTVVEDLEQAAHDGDEGAACFLMQAFVASCLTMSHHLWPGGRRITDHLVVGVAQQLRESLGVDEGSLLASDQIAPLGVAIRFDRQDCRQSLDLHAMTVRIGDDAIPLRPLFTELRSLWERAAQQVDRVPSVA